MKIAYGLIFVFLAATVLVSGCVQQAPATNGAGNGNAGNEPATGQMTSAQAEDNAAATVSQEMDSALGNMTLDDVQNELLRG